MTILTGSSIATASGDELEPYRSNQTIVKTVYYPESAFLTFQNNGTIPEEPEAHFMISYKYVPAANTNTVSE